jgi:YD repeat-containing protein
LAWARVNGPTTLGDIAPGGVQNIQLVLEPPSSLTSQAYASNPLLEVRSSNASAVPVNTLITLTASGSGNVVYSVINADKPRVLGQGEPIPTAEGQLVSLDIAGLSFRAVADANGVVRLLNVPAGRYSYTVKASGFEESKGVQTIEPGVTLTKEILLLTQVVTYEWTVVPTTIEDQYNITLGITFKTDVPAPVVVMEPAVFNFNLEGGQSVDAQITVTNKGFIAADNVVVRPNITDTAIQIDMPYSVIPRLAAGQSLVVPFRLTLVHASCHQASVSADFQTICAAGAEVTRSVPPVQISAGTCFGIPTTSVGGPASTSNPFTNTTGGSGSGGISLSVPGSYVSFAVPNPPAPPSTPNTCKAPKEKFPAECFLCDEMESVYADPTGDPRIPESDLAISVAHFDLPLDFSRVYDSQDYEPSSMGIAWRHSFESRVSLLRATSTFFRKRGDTVMMASYGGGAGGTSLAAITTEVGAGPVPPAAPIDTIVELRTPSGRRLVYRHTGGTSFSAPKGETGVLQVQGTTTTPTGFMWTLADQTIYTYDANGKLLTIKDRNDNTVTLVYDGSGKLMEVRDPDNRSLYSLGYDGSGRLGTVTDLTGRVVSLTYNGSGFLNQAGPWPTCW